MGGCCSTDMEFQFCRTETVLEVCYATMWIQLTLLNQIHLEVVKRVNFILADFFVTIKIKTKQNRFLGPTRDLDENFGGWSWNLRFKKLPKRSGSTFKFEKFCLGTYFPVSQQTNTFFVLCALSHPYHGQEQVGILYNTLHTGIYLIFTENHFFELFFSSVVFLPSTFLLPIGNSDFVLQEGLDCCYCQVTCSFS